MNIPDEYKFSSAMVKALDRHTHDGRGIGRLMEEWEKMVEDCERNQNGTFNYQASKVEFDNDSMVRVEIEKVITDPEVTGFIELQPIAEKIRQLDQRMEKSEMRKEYARFKRIYLEPLKHLPKSHEKTN